MKIRRCLRCDGPFVSWGRGNRLCESCRESNRDEVAARASVPKDVLLQVAPRTDVQALLDETS